MEQLLLMGKVQTVMAEQGVAVGGVGGAEALQEWLSGLLQLRGINEFFGDFVEIAA